MIFIIYLRAEFWIHFALIYLRQLFHTPFFPTASAWALKLLIIFSYLFVFIFCLTLSALFHVLILQSLVSSLFVLHFMCIFN